MLERHVDVLSSKGGGQEQGSPVSTSPRWRLLRLTREDFDVLCDCVGAYVLVFIFSN